ncbi:hypothetical protein [Novosphingobium mangrovi (ex Huang et al. 2023)]|uniref:Glycosyltransferase RgtA/B/C/D-like domain-containing protein n=1 Tax=Novosphingobium mangrovi (ex Huang et al. 2023) TaxID=2976432 RepID=A0ABT2I5A6_9SPHN|nr:hypothetical protein [Novosphingobium mangrovi (ex Huang et al. 2023)]MCT2399732.1 hypothetical protein [Novosphingobium mangrovi (ex Huang et al. 2023)]
MFDHDESAHNAPCMAAVTIALAALVIAITWTAFERGPWYDEFYTQYVTRPGPGWFEALTTSWLADNHPPFFYMLMRATAWMGAIEPHRLVNLAVAAVAVLGGWLVVRGEARLRAPAAIMVLLLTANHWTMHSGTELRSYFTSLCAGALLSLTLASIWLSPSKGEWSRQAVYALTVLVAFNTHIITTLFSGAFIVPFLTVALLRRDRERLRALFPAPIAAGVVFLSVTALQFSHWEQNTQVFWIAGGFNSARYSMEYAVQRTLEANPLILLGSVAGTVLLCRDVLRTRKVPELLELCLLAGVGLCLAFALLMGIHLIRPVIIEKYLTAAVGTVAFVMAAACTRLLSALPRRVEVPLLFLALAVSLLALADNARKVAALNSWMGTGRLIARTVASCPQTTVHTDDFWNADVMAMSPADNRYVAPWAYKRIATRLGFHIAPASSRALSATCPNLFWAEHDTTRRFDETSVLEHIRQSGFAIRSITLYRVGDGWVASDRPLLPTED